MAKIYSTNVNTRTSLKYFTRAEEIFTAHKAEVELSKVAFWRGKTYLALSKYKDAIKNFSIVMSDIAQKEPNSQYVLSTHAFMIRAYEGLGMRDAAAKHRQAIGKAKPFDEGQDILPVYTQQPTYPMDLLRSGVQGYATILITVDENGFVKDPKMVEGNELFKNTSIATIKRFRYKPRLVNGKAVETKGVKYRFTYIIAD